MCTAARIRTRSGSVSTRSSATLRCGSRMGRVWYLMRKINMFGRCFISICWAMVMIVIIGGGGVGKLLQSILVCRGQPVPTKFDGLIYVCTRNDDLNSLIDSVPQSHWNDLVFFQNGMFDPWFESKGLKDKLILGLFVRFKAGEAPIDGKTNTNPEGLTASFGKWASAIATRLYFEGLSYKVLEKDGSTTAGNSSQVSDGAGAVLLMRRDIALQKGFPVFGVFKSFAAVGVDPAVMGIGPAIVMAMESMSLPMPGRSNPTTCYQMMLRFKAHVALIDALKKKGPI